MFLALAGDTTITQAIANTLMGMGTVFLILIFIMIIISAFVLIGKAQNALANRGKKEELPVEPVKASKAATPAPTENLMNDSELVAVITAAIYAASAGAGATSKDQLVVRSIRRAR